MDKKWVAAKMKTGYLRLYGQTDYELGEGKVNQE